MKNLLLIFCLLGSIQLFAQTERPEIKESTFETTQETAGLKLTMEIIESPVYGQIITKFEGLGKAKLLILEVFDVYGNHVHKESVKTNGSSQYTFDLKKLKAGDYFLKINTGSQKTAYKITLK